jgi:hypothetical protein
MAKGFDFTSITPLLLGGAAIYFIYKSGFLNQVGSGIQDIGSGAGSIGSGLGMGLNSIGSGVGYGVGNLGFGLGEGFALIGSGINNLGLGFEGLGTGLGNFAQELGGGAGNFLSGSSPSAIISATLTAGKNFSNPYNSTLQYPTDIFSSISGTDNLKSNLPSINSATLSPAANSSNSGSSAGLRKVTLKVDPFGNKNTTVLVNSQGVPIASAVPQNSLASLLHLSIPNTFNLK